MSWKATAHVKELTHAPGGEPISRSEKLLLLIIADYYNDERKCAWASVDTIAKNALLCPRRIQQVMRSAERKGILQVSQRAGRSSIYRLPTLDLKGGEIFSGVKPASPLPLKPVSPPPLKPASPEQSFEPSFEPSVSQSVVFESGGMKWQLTKDPTTGRDVVRRIRETTTDDASTRSDEAGGNSRWTLSDDDDGSFDLKALLDEYQRATSNPVTKSDREIAELIGATLRFSSSACVDLMRDIARRAPGKISSLAYFRAALREVHTNCEQAAFCATTMGVGFSVQLKAVRKELDRWRNHKSRCTLIKA